MRLVRLVRSIFDIRLRELSARSGVSVRELARIESGEVQAGKEAVAALDKTVAAIIDERAQKGNVQS